VDGSRGTNAVSAAGPTGMCAYRARIDAGDALEQTLEGVLQSGKHGRALGGRMGPAWPRRPDTRKRPKELVGGPLVVSHRLRTSPESLRSARDPRSPALRPSNPAPGTAPWITPRSGLAVRTCPFGQDEQYRRGSLAHNGLIHEVASRLAALIPDFYPDVDDMWMVVPAMSVQHPPGRGGRRFRWGVGGR
jgi:hypothetical protein